MQKLCTFKQTTLSTDSEKQIEQVVFLLVVEPERFRRISGHKERRVKRSLEKTLMKSFMVTSEKRAYSILFLSPYFNLLILNFLLKLFFYSLHLSAYRIFWILCLMYLNYIFSWVDAFLLFRLFSQVEVRFNG